MTYKCKPIVLMYFFWLTYTLIFMPTYFFDFSFPIYIEGYEAKFLLDKAFIVHITFLTFVAFFQKKIKHNVYFFSHTSGKERKLTFWMTWTVMIIFAFFSVSGDSILNTGGYTLGKIQQLGGFLPGEYFLIFLPIGYLFSGENKFKQKLVLFAGVVFAVNGLLYGFRNYMLQCGLLIFIIFFDRKSLAYIKLIPLLILGYLFLHWFGKIRGNIAAWSNFNLAEDLTASGGTIGESIVNSLGNQFDILYASIRLYAFIEMGLLGVSERLTSFLTSHLAVFVPFRFLPDLANLAAYKQNVYYSGGGGLISCYYYVYAGYLGVFIIAYFITWIMNHLLITRSNLFILYGAMVLCTYPRWFGYNPITLIKLSFYVIPVYLLIRFVFSRNKIIDTNHICAA